jgi:signal transduction histidine kinase
VQLPSSLRAYLAEPAAPDPPRRVWRDWALIAIASLIAVLETALRNDAEWLAISPAWRRGELAVFFVAVPPALLVRRTHPLWALSTAFVPITVYSVIMSQTEDVYGGLVTMAVALITVYTVYRWGSGRDGAIGSAVVISVGIIGLVCDPSSTLGDWIGGFIVLSLPVMIGLVVRYRGTARDRAIDAAKAHEREELARELHDTVAHHVSAIAVQAQAGRALAATDPQRALTVLQVIEEAASRTLADMRSMVGTLRDGAAELTPRHGVADLPSLAHGTPGGPAIEVSIDRELGELGPASDAALYRIARESITNALRHARAASTVTVRVDGASELVRLTVRDDGQPPVGSRGEGYGLLGMAERAELLGGTFSAGPDGRQGWRVEAELPRWM